jgi:hemolysin III
MTTLTFPSPKPSHRRADLVVHFVGLALILIAGSLLISKSTGRVDPKLFLVIVVYVLCALASNLASFLCHFAPWHDQRKLLRRIDHAAIYPSTCRIALERESGHCSDDKFLNRMVKCQSK